MKKLYFALALLCMSLSARSQCMMQVSCNWVTCYGSCDGVATAYPVNAVAPTFMWMPGGQTTQTITGLCAGTYTCVMTDSTGCVATAQCTVGSPAPLQVSISNFANPSCQSCCDGYAVAQATGGSGAYTYLWTPIMQTSSTAQALCNGSYTVCVTDAMGCVSCDTVAVSFGTGITANSNATSMNVTPQGENLFILNAAFAEPTAGEIVVTNVLGEVVQQQSFGVSGTIENLIDLSACGAGMYFVSVVTANGTETERIMKN